MRRFTLLNLCLVLAAVVVIGGGVFLARYHLARGEQAEPPVLSESYTHPTLGFSFRYPSNFKVNEIPHGEGSETVLVEDPLHDRQGLQVFMQPYDDAEPLTEARIKQDQPDITMENVAPSSVAGEQGISFVQLQSDDVGRTYEVWFVHHGTLYEVATYAERGADLTEILATWQFR